MTREIIFWAMNILGGMVVVVVGGGALGESANLSQRVQNGSSKLLSSAVVGEKAQ